MQTFVNFQCGFFTFSALFTLAVRLTLGAKNSNVIKLFLKEASFQLGVGLTLDILIFMGHKSDLEINDH